MGEPTPIIRSGARFMEYTDAAGIVRLAPVQLKDFLTPFEVDLERVSTREHWKAGVCSERAVFVSEVGQLIILDPMRIPRGIEWSPKLDLPLRPGTFLGVFCGDRTGPWFVVAWQHVQFVINLFRQSVFKLEETLVHPPSLYCMGEPGRNGRNVFLSRIIQEQATRLLRIHHFSSGEINELGQADVHSLSAKHLQSPLSIHIDDGKVITSWLQVSPEGSPEAICRRPIDGDTVERNKVGKMASAEGYRLEHVRAFCRVNSSKQLAFCFVARTRSEGAGVYFTTLGKDGCFSAPEQPHSLQALTKQDFLSVHEFSLPSGRTEVYGIGEEKLMRLDESFSVPSYEPRVTTQRIISYAVGGDFIGVQRQNNSIAAFHRDVLTEIDASGGVVLLSPPVVIRNAAHYLSHRESNNHLIWECKPCNNTTSA